MRRADGAAAFLAQRALHAAGRDLPGGGDPEEQSGEDGERAREREHDPVDADLVRARYVRG
jgi:hypothetical protein